MSIDKISAASLDYLEQKHIVSILEEAFHQVLVKLPDDPLELLQSAFLSTTPLRLAVIGPPCSGKSKQCALIANRYNLLHIQPEKLIAAAVEARSTDERSKYIAYCLANNITVPDEIVTELVIEATARGESEWSGWICDNFPQSRVQAIYLQTRAVCPQKLFMLNTSDDICMQRYIATMKKERNSSSLQKVTQNEKSKLNSNELLERLSSFAARRSELVDCYKSFCVCIDDSVGNASRSKQTVPVDSNNAHDRTKSNDATLTNISEDNIFSVICSHIDEIHTQEEKTVFNKKQQQQQQPTNNEKIDYVFFLCVEIIYAFMELLNDVYYLNNGVTRYSINENTEIDIFSLKAHVHIKDFFEVKN